jgi:hypothetical protein
MSKNIYTQLCEEIDRDFAILSSKSRDQLKSMIERAMREAHARGSASLSMSVPTDERPYRPPLKTPRPSAS